MNGVIIPAYNGFPLLSNDVTASSLETVITPGNSYTIPNDGYYTLYLRNDDPNHTRSANFGVNNANLIRSNNEVGCMAVVPLKKGTVLTTRANFNSSDQFYYQVVSSFAI